MRVEFRFLNFRASPVAGAPYVVGLVHLAAGKLSTATSLNNVPRQTLVASPGFDLRSILVTLECGWRTLAVNELTELTVVEGRGGSLEWSAIRHGQTEDAEAHFNALKEAAGLAELASSRVVARRTAIRDAKRNT